MQLRFAPWLLIPALATAAAHAADAGPAGADAGPAAEAAPAAPEAPRDEAKLSDGPAASAKQGVAFFEELMRKTPEDASAHQLLAAAYARDGRLDDARREARRAIELAPTDPEMQQALGLIEEGAKNTTAALEALQKAAALDGNVEYRLDVARVLQQAGRYTEADAAYAKISTDFEKNLDVQLALANAYKEAGKIDEAAAVFEKALAMTAAGAPQRIDILVEKGRMMADRGRNPEALELLTRARSEAPKDPEVHYNLGVLYVRIGQPEAAINAFKEAIKLEPASEDRLGPKAQNNLGVAYDKSGKIEEAYKAFSDAVRQDPRFADAQYNAGLAAFKLRKFKEARAAFEKALEISPEMGDAKFYLGEVYYQLGDSAKALRVYKEALRTKPDDASTHRRLGDLYLEQGEVNVAVGEYWAAVDTDEKDTGNRAQLMRVLLVRNDEGDVRRAVKLGEQGLALDPRSLEIREALAQAETQNSRALRAQQVLEEGVTLMPDSAQAHVLLGRFLLDQSTEKSIPEAQAHFDAALKIDPKNAVALAASGEAAYTQGDKVTARKRFQEALAIDSTLAEARADLGRLLYEDNQNDRALKELERATQDAPKLGKAWFYLAFAQNKAGKGAAVVEKSLKKAVECQPDLAEANYQLGKIYVAQSKKELAIAAFKAAVASRPAYEEALLELARLTEPTAP